MRRVKRLHDSLRGKPVLHLDVTLRPELAGCILPPMPVEHVDVATPHMHVRHVAGSFGKSMLCPGSDLLPAEAQRRANRLQECVDYVAWHARRVFPAEVLIVTDQAIEDAFAAIPNVVTAHFNAVAGLDIYRDVAMLISIGRPLPPSQEAEALAQVLFGNVASSVYVTDQVGVHMRAGPPRGLAVVRHDDETAEILRAAICDDELVQVIGRGRGVNRSGDHPLEVHVLADVALPLDYDRLTTRELEQPDVLQKMLLRGIATDSPGDAAVLHPDLFRNEKQSQKEFERSGFKRQNPMKGSYREMSLKSAAYRRPGRGRSWQSAYWLSGTAEDARGQLESGLGDDVEWRSDAWS
ncbi:hypothetical protein ACFORG_20460 [Lutimaribacter marinistellae]|uniref:Uncharacterized protein n=1 Tax=Lutimaribacter marinistellae TaxID=1820329 RepID=A0ABV7TKE9_9RHOB